MPDLAFLLPFLSIFAALAGGGALIASGLHTDGICLALGMPVAALERATPDEP